MRPMLKDMDTSEIVVSSIRVGMKREFAFMMKAQSELRGIPAGRRVTRSQSVGNSSRRYPVRNSKIHKKIKGSASKKLKKNEEEKPEKEVVRKLEPVNVSDGDNGADRSLVDVVPDIDNCVRNLEADLVYAEVNGAEKVGADCSEGIAQSLYTDSPAAQIGDSTIVEADSREDIVQPMYTDSAAGQIGDSARVSTHEDRTLLSRSSDLGCENTGEGTPLMLEKPLRRFTRSALKLREAAGKLDPIDVSNGENGAERSVVDVVPNCIRNLEADLVSVEVHDAEKVGLDSMEGIVQSSPMAQVGYSAIVEADSGEGIVRSSYADSPLTEVGDSAIVEADSGEDIRQSLYTYLPVAQIGASARVSTHEDCAPFMLEKPLRRVTRSSLKLQEDVGKLVPVNVADGDNGPERSVVDVVSDMDNCIRNLEADLVSVEVNDAEKVGAASIEGIVQSLHTDLPLAQVGGSATVDPDSREDIIHSLYTDSSVAQIEDSARVSTHKDSTPLMLEKPLRRFTRSALKLQDVEIEIRSPAGDVETLTPSPSKLEMKMSKKIGLKRIPGRLKDLLVTGLLEGLHVRYVNGSKGKKQSESELRGIIKGTGILCSCNECGGKKVVTPNQFEVHAHSANKRPPQYIYLENGKCLKDVLNACKANLSDSLEAVIQNAIGRSNYTTAFCLNCKGLIPEAGCGRAMLLCDSCVTTKASSPSQTQNSDSCGLPKESTPSQTLDIDSSILPKESSPSHTQDIDSCMLPNESNPSRTHDIVISCILPKESSPSQTQNSDIIHRSPLVGSLAHVSSSCLPEVVGSVQFSSNSQRQVKSTGKLTRKDLRLHKSVLAEDLLPDGTALSYVIHGEIKLEGYKKDGAIFCFCCKKVVSPSQFEAHAGFASRRKPYMSIYTSNGVSLHQLSLEISRSRKSSTEENDDLCSICKDGGELLCCENCPRSFHPECVGLSSIPQEAWYCKYCQNMFEKEKFAEQNANAIAAGRVPGVDPLEDITRRCIRIIANVEKYIGGGCIICRVDQFSKSGFNDHTVMICDQCEREYHVKCLREQQIDDLKALPEAEWFCSKECSSIHSILQKLIGGGEQRLPEAVLNILEKKDDGEGLEQNPKPDIRWRLLRGKAASEDTRMWLSGAVTIFHDRFDPIADASTSRLDLIPTMVYGRKFKDQEFYGMYCAILTVDSVVVSAAIVRVFGEEVAELPLVATRTDCQGKGYFQALFVCIENLLLSLNVKNLVLPAADEAESLWKNRFGFEKLGKEQLDEYNKSYQLMIFQGTSVLHKSLIPKS